MKQRILFVFLVVCLLAIGAKSQTAQEVIPGAGWQEGWAASYEVLSYEGDDLFFLINGGADLYMEYGFADVAAVELSHPQKGNLYIELYRMDSDSAAFGIFSLRRGDISIEIYPAPWAAYGDDVLHVWNGNFYMMVSGGQMKTATLETFTKLVAYLSEKVPAENELPGVARKLSRPKGGHYAYLMGPLALNNIYSFGPGDVFHTREVVVMFEDNQKHLNFYYESEPLAEEVFAGVRVYMENSGRFNDFQGDHRNFHAVDRRGNRLLGKYGEKMIQVTVEEAKE